MSLTSDSPPASVAPRFTPRQAQVLDLLVRGYSNAQIADELGVSLDGAKWHVREILSTLGVATREDAAEYWRRHNGLPSRFARLARALVPGGAALRLALGVGAVAVVAGAAWALVALLNQDDGPGEASGTITTTATPSAQLTGTATPAAPTATPSAVRTGPDGVPIQPLALGPDVPVPADTALYYSWAGIEGPYQNLFRAFTNSAGELVIENLYARLPAGQPYASVQDYRSGRMAVALCRVAYCGGYAEAEEDSQGVLALSDDGGITWREAGRLPVAWYPAGFLPEGLLGVQYTGESQQPNYAFWPDGPAVASPVPGGYALHNHNELLFVNEDESRVYDRDGNVAWEKPAIPGAVQVWPLIDMPGLRWTGWFEVPATGPGAQFWGERVNGKFTRIYSEPPEGTLYFWSAYTDEVAVGRLDTPDMQHLDPVFIDLAKGVVHRITGLGTPRGYFVSHGAQRGPFLVAAPGAGECLNVRNEPALTGTVVTCAADGVLLVVRGEGQVEAGGTTWRAVTLPDGREGWASSEFLR